MGASFAQEPERPEEEKASIYKQATEIARGFVWDRPASDTASLNVDAIMAEAERFSVEAREMQSSMTTRLAGLGEGVGTSDFISAGGEIDASELASAAGSIARASKESSNDTPLFVTFISLAMPDASLTSIIHDTHEAGGVVMVRGFYGGSYGSFANRVRELFEEGDEVGISIDPRYFQAAGIKTVPTYAVLLGEPNCEGFVCAPLEADTLSGNISVAAALKLLSEQGSVAPAQARAALAALERGS